VALLAGCASNLKNYAWRQSFNSGVKFEEAIAKCEYDLHILGLANQRMEYSIMGAQHPTLEACMKRYGFVWKKKQEESLLNISKSNLSIMSCQVNTDCAIGFTCRSKAGGGSECRASLN
jgi:hypothetical protein